MIKKIFLAFTFFCLGIFAKEIPERPLQSYVYDENRLLSSQETRIFNIIAEELYQKTGVGLALAVFQNIEGEDFRDFAFRIADSWKIGSKGKDGVLIFVTLEEKRRSVEVGYALEGILPDALVERFQQQTLVPAFRKGLYGKGILELALELANHIAKENQVVLEFQQGTLDSVKAQEKPVSGFSVLLFVLVFCVLIFTKRGRTFLIYFLLSGILRSTVRSFVGRGGGFGGGFGGGSFGGGGSGGSW